MWIRHWKLQNWRNVIVPTQWSMMFFFVVVGKLFGDFVFSRLICKTTTVADVGEGPWGPGSPLIFGKRHFLMTSPLVQGVDPPLETAQLKDYGNPYSVEYVSFFFVGKLFSDFCIFKTTVYKSQEQSRKVFSLTCMIIPQVSPAYPIKSCHEVIIFFF